MLKLKDFSVEHILDNVSTTFDIGKTYVVMGSNGVGKSTLLHGIMGRPDLNVSGEMTFMGSDLTELETDERARMIVKKGRRDKYLITKADVNRVMKNMGLRYKKVVHIANTANSISSKILRQ